MSLDNIMGPLKGKVPFERSRWAESTLVASGRDIFRKSNCRFQSQQAMQSYQDAKSARIQGKTYLRDMKPAEAIEAFKAALSLDKDAATKIGPKDPAVNSRWLDVALDYTLLGTAYYQQAYAEGNTPEQKLSRFQQADNHYVEAAKIYFINQETCSKALASLYHNIALLYYDRVMADPQKLLETSKSPYWEFETEKYLNEKLSSKYRDQKVIYLENGLLYKAERLMADAIYRDPKLEERALVTELLHAKETQKRKARKKSHQVTSKAEVFLKQLSPNQLNEFRETIRALSEIAQMHQRLWGETPAPDDKKYRRYEAMAQLNSAVAHHLGRLKIPGIQKQNFFRTPEKLYEELVSKLSKMDTSVNPMLIRISAVADHNQGLLKSKLYNTPDLKIVFTIKGLMSMSAFLKNKSLSLTPAIKTEIAKMVQVLNTTLLQYPKLSKEERNKLDKLDPQLFEIAKKTKIEEKDAQLPIFINDFEVS